MVVSPFNLTASRDSAALGHRQPLSGAGMVYRERYLAAGVNVASSRSTRRSWTLVRRRSGIRSGARCCWILMPGWLVSACGMASLQVEAHVVGVGESHNPSAVGSSPTRPTRPT